MSKPRATAPEDRQFKHVELDEGDWVDLKKKLDYGDGIDLNDATYRSGIGAANRGTERVMQMSTFQVQRVLLYVVRWSFVDTRKKAIPLTVDGVRSLEPETAMVLHELINDIEAENKALEDAVKNGGTTEGTPAPSPALSLVPASASQGVKKE